MTPEKTNNISSIMFKAVKHGKIAFEKTAKIMEEIYAHCEHCDGVLWHTECPECGTKLCLDCIEDGYCPHCGAEQ